MKYPISVTLSLLLLVGIVIWYLIHVSPDMSCTERFEKCKITAFPDYTKCEHELKSCKE